MQEIITDDPDVLRYLIDKENMLIEGLKNRILKHENNIKNLNAKLEAVDRTSC
jgi:hypothetical protein